MIMRNWLINANTIAHGKGNLLMNYLWKKQESLMKIIPCWTQLAILVWTSYNDGYECL
jgi:hypothetical protein